MEDIVQTSISTGPRGAFRLAQGIQAVLAVGSEWLTDVSKVCKPCFMLQDMFSLVLLVLTLESYTAQVMDSWFT